MNRSMANRIIILLVLLATIYVVYKYQSQVPVKVTENKKPEPTINSTTDQMRNDILDKLIEEESAQDEDSINKITIDNVSQISIGSDEDDGSDLSFANNSTNSANSTSSVLFR